MTGRQREWLDLQLQLPKGSGGEVGDGGAPVDGVVTAVLTGWLQRIALDGTRADRVLAAACCSAAAPR